MTVGRSAAAGVALLVLAGVVTGSPPPPSESGAVGRQLREVSLPEPRSSGPVSVEEAIRERRSVRDFRREPLELSHLSQLLWAAQGVTGPRGFRAAPSAGALHPLEIFIVAGAVEELRAGVYRYRPRAHALAPVRSGDRRRELARAAPGQSWIAGAPAALVAGAVFSRTTDRYGERGRRYVHMEVGHVAENVYLQAEALGLGTTIVGAFRDDDLARAVGMEPDEAAMAILPVGTPAPGG